MVDVQDELLHGVQRNNLDSIFARAYKKSIVIYFETLFHPSLILQRISVQIESCSCALSSSTAISSKIAEGNRVSSIVA